MKTSIVAALGNNRVLGLNNELLWHIPDDLKRFKQLTQGHPVIMGRKTFESIVSLLGKPLPGRTNIVITRDAQYKAHVMPDAEFVVAASVNEALQYARSLVTDEVFVIGGGQIYTAALPQTDKLYLTCIDDTKDGDTFFPPYENDFTNKVFEEVREWNGLKYTWVDLER